MSYSAVMWSTSRKLQLLDTCRGARCFDCVIDNATYLAVTDQVSHWLQETAEWVGQGLPWREWAGQEAEEMQ